MLRTTPQIKVLIAERTLGTAERIAKFLKWQGYSIAGIVNSAEQALEFAITTVPDVVLLDLPLHGEMDTLTAGWKILSEVNCPVVYMTTYPGAVVNQAATLNPYGFLLKPFTIDELKTTIEQTLHQHQTTHFIAEQEHLFAKEAFATETDTQILALLTFASQLTPQPRILLVGGCVLIYTSTLDAAATLQAFCQDRFFAYPYQLFVWRWKNRQYELYAQTSLD